MPTRDAYAKWEGDLAKGHGTIRFSSGAFEGPYSFSSRFENGTGTNPEELIAAAHAGCFTMALSNGLAQAGYPPTRVETTAKVHLVKNAQGFSIPQIDLITEAEVPGIDQVIFHQLAAAAKKDCPVSKLLANAEITLDAKLVPH